jgi:hypothetical protein
MATALSSARAIARASVGKATRAFRRPFCEPTGHSETWRHVALPPVARHLVAGPARSSTPASKRESNERPLPLRRNLTEAGAEPAGQIAADLRARQVRAADELTRLLLDAERGAVAIDHAHVRAIAVEANQLIRAPIETFVIVTADAYVRLEPREAARSAREALWNGRHLRSLCALYPPSAPASAWHVDELHAREGRSP